MEIGTPDPADPDVNTEEEPVRIGEFDQASLAGSFACAIDGNQHLYCWGWSDRYSPNRAIVGSIGVGDTRPRLSPTRVGTDQWLQVAARPNGGTCGIKVDGTLWCWGNEVLVPTQLGTATWKQIRYADSGTCAIQSDDSLWCWGGPHAVGGEKIGDGWQRIEGEGGEFGADDAFCGLRNDGRRWCYERDDGEAGVLYEADSFEWLKVPGPGPDAACGIQADFSLWCDVGFGLNQRGTDSWQSVHKGEWSSCGVKTDGTWWCWDDYGWDGAEGPTQVETDSDWARTWVGSGYQCATKVDGSFWCFGSDSLYQLGDGGLEPTPNPTVVSPSAWKKVVAGGGMSCGIDEEEGLWCWGTGQALGLGGEPYFPVTSVEPAKIGSAKWLDIDVTVSNPFGIGQSVGRHACGIQTDRTMWCWGDFLYGQLGIGETGISRNEPTRVAGSDWASVSAGDGHTCALKTDGSLWCWGKNSENQIGIGTDSVGTNQAVTSPVRVGDAEWKQVTAGHRYTCGLQVDDSLWCWGLNTSGAVLGDPSLGSGDSGTVGQPVPARIGDASWESVSAGVLHTCGLQLDGSLWCWGVSKFGELGLGDAGNPEFVNVPTRVGDATWDVVDAGGGHTCGIKADGTMWCWGDGYKGQLGLGDFEGVDRPRQVGSDAGWADVSAGGYRTLALRAS